MTSDASHLPPIPSEAELRTKIRALQKKMGIPTQDEYDCRYRLLSPTGRQETPIEEEQMKPTKKDPKEGTKADKREDRKKGKK